MGPLEHDRDHRLSLGRHVRLAQRREPRPVAHDVGLRRHIRVGHADRQTAPPARVPAFRVSHLLDERRRAPRRAVLDLGRRDGELLTHIFEYVAQIILANPKFRAIAGSVLTDNDLSELERCTRDNIVALEEITGFDREVSARARRWGWPSRRWFARGSCRGALSFPDL